MTLKQYRNSLGLTLEQAGGKLGMSKQGYSQLEKRWPDISAKNMLALTRHLGAPIIIDVLKGARFATPEENERLKNPTSQDDLIDSLDYLPDVD